jgi:alkylation response protein AidB-like acyl-CoA dehydrogenase
MSSISVQSRPPAPLKSVISYAHSSTNSAVEIAKRVGPTLAEQAAGRPSEDDFVAPNFALLKNVGLVHAAVPGELGGGGADIGELSSMLRTIGYYCGSTGLAFAMHTHQVAIPAWRWQHQPAAKAAVEPLLKRIADEQLVLLSSGGSDWIGGSGTAEKVEGGYRITARKIFVSGAPAGNLLMTGAVLNEPGLSPMVLHFGVPMNSPHVRVLDTWRTLGMRGTGSHDVEIDGYVVPENAVSLKRKAGEWHLLFQIIGTIAFPLVYSVYVGVAESARDIAVGLAKRRGTGHHAVDIAGRMDTELATARMALEHMIAIVRQNSPSASSINEVMIGRQLVGRHAIAAVEYAMELAGGQGFYRAAGLEQKFRDIQAARYHPLRTGSQIEYAGALALDLPVDRIW